VRKGRSGIAWTNFYTQEAGPWINKRELFWDSVGTFNNVHVIVMTLIGLDFCLADRSRMRTRYGDGKDERAGS